MQKLLLALALLAPTLAGAQSWSFANNVAVPYTTAVPGLHGLAVDSQDRLWVQNINATETIQRNGADRTTRALYVLNADGSSAPCSPILYITNGQGTRIDTLGVYTTAAGAVDTRTGRGLESDASGNILASQFDVLYSLDAASCATAPANSITQLARALPFPGVSITGAGADDKGNAYVTTVATNAPIIEYGPGLVQGQNVIAEQDGIGRKLVASADGRFVFDLSFTTSGSVVHYRADEFSAFTQLGITVRGLRSESGTVQPGTNWVWLSSGPAGAFSANSDATVATFYQNNAWYGYAIEDLIQFDAAGMATGTIENPSPRDSIVVGADYRAADGAEVVGPRGIAFSRDGMTAYVGNFGVPAAIAVKKYTKNPVSIAGGVAPTGFALGQNQPNPFLSSTEIELTLPEADHVRMRVFDTMGRVVATLVDGQMAAGDHRIAFNAGDLAAGVYVYSVEVNGYGTTRRMAIVR